VRSYNVFNRNTARYLYIAFFIILFVVLYVWQNIGVMRLKMELNGSRKSRAELVKKNDRMRYEIEKFKRVDVVESFAVKNGMRPAGPGDFEVIEENRKK
jgi:hypothetical protein